MRRGLQPCVARLPGSAITILVFLVLGSMSHAADSNAVTLATSADRLRPLHAKISPPGPHDWLANHVERGQTFRQYLDSSPVRPTTSRRVIWIQPIGTFTKEQREVVRLTAGFMGSYFGLPVRIEKDMPLTSIPRRARRTHPDWGMEQILSTYVLDEILRPRLPSNAVAFIGFTASDLWPGEGWNFVFGQASLREHTGIWSIYRNGNPTEGAEAFRLCLLRTMKTAVHETCHIFSMEHCTAYECCMCGSNNREESDRRPVWLCPECMPKLCWATGADPLARYTDLAKFCRMNRFTAEEQFYEKSIGALTSSAQP